MRPDRATIHSGDDSVASEESETGKGSRWNQWLFEECIVDAWISNLEFISHLFEDHKEAGWKHWPIGQQAHEGTHLGSGTLGRVFERVLSRGQKLIPTISGSLTSGSDMIFAEKLESSLETALLEAGLIVVCPPNDRAFELAKTHFIEHGIRLLTPQSMRAALNALSCEIEDLSASSRSTFLDYIISDRSYGEIGRCSAPLLPMMNGTYCGFTRSKTGPRIRFNKANEADIFSQCSSFSIDSSKLSPKTLLQFTNEIDRLVSCTNIHYWDLEGAVWYAERYTFALNRDCLDDIISINGLAEWVDKLWIWGITAYPGAFMAAAENLWLLPLCGDRFRKIHTSSKGLVLDISGHGDIASTLRPICQSSKIGALFPILSTGVSNQVLQELKYGGCIADCDVILDFISWLHQNPNFFESIDDASKSSLVRHIGRKIPQDLLGPDFRKLRYYLRALPIFRLAFKDK